MKIFATFPFFILMIGFLTFQSAYAYVPQITVTIREGSDGDLIYHNSNVDFTIQCQAISYNKTVKVFDNNELISTFGMQGGDASFDYSATGRDGDHYLLFQCIDDTGQVGREGIVFNQVEPTVTSQVTPQSQQNLPSQNIITAQPQDTFHFDNGLFTLVFIGMIILTFILILALSHGGHFRRRERLEPIRQSTSIFDMYHGNAVSFRPSDIRGSLPRGYDDAEVSVELPPPTKILDSIWNDPEAKKENVRRLANDPVAMMEAKRIEMTNNLERKCPKCSDPLRNQNNEIIHCVFCCKIFHTTEELDTHNCKKAKEAGM